MKRRKKKWQMQRTNFFTRCKPTSDDDSPFFLASFRFSRTLESWQLLGKKNAKHKLSTTTTTAASSLFQLEALISNAKPKHRWHRCLFAPYQRIKKVLRLMLFAFAFVIKWTLSSIVKRWEKNDSNCGGGGGDGCQGFIQNLQWEKHFDGWCRKLWCVRCKWKSILCVLHSNLTSFH